LIRGRDIVVLSSIDWDLLWQGQHEVASRLARAENRVLYIENTGVRSPRFTEARRVASRVWSSFRSPPRRGAREVAPNLHVFSPLVLPPFGSRWRRAVNRRLLLPPIRRVAAKLGMRDPIVWTYLPTDTAVDLIGLLRTPRSVVLYTCVADFAELTPHRHRLADAEKTLVQSSDLVFAQGSALVSHCKRWSERVHPIDCAVSLDSFTPPDDGSGPGRTPGARRDGGASHPSLAALPRPVIGYVGGLHRHVDVPLAVQMARARPHWSWVYVGPAQIPVAELAALPNVRLVGHVPHDILAHYIESFDVCTVPYRVGPATEAVFPTKVNEYLAMGKPVVSTPLPEVREFNARNRVLITAAAKPDAFGDAIEQALVPVPDEQRVARRRAAASRDWGTQLESMSTVIEAITAMKEGEERSDPARAKEPELLAD
jgi:glycosyltransferase involved in cell wall biosynthesis